MKLVDQPRVFRYAAAFVFTGLALLLRSALDPWLAEVLPLATLYGAIAATVFYGGVGPALLAAALGFFAASWLFVEPRATFALSEAGGLSFLTAHVVSAALIIGVGYAARRGRERVEWYAKVLEQQGARLRQESEQRRKAELDAEAAHDRASMILHSITDCCYGLDRQWRFTEFTPQAARYFGRSREEVLGRDIWDVFPRARGSPFEINYRRAVEEGVPAHFECLSPTTGRFAEVHAYPVEEGLAVFFRDITERKRAEEALRDSEVSLRAECDREQLYFDVAGAILVVLDAQGSVLRINRSGLAILGYEHDSQVIGRSWIDDFIPEADRAATRELFTEVIAGRTALPESYENTVLRRDGAERLIEWRSALLRDADGRISGAVGSGQDITERRALDAALRRSQRELEQQMQKLADADRRKNEFLATLAHELRNPLAPIRNATQLLMLDGPQKMPAHDPRAVIERQTAQLARLVDDLLDVSRITHGRIKLQRERIDLATAVSSAIEQARALVDAAGHHLAVRLPEEPVYIDGDATRLAQIVANLLNNACKYTQPGGSISLRLDSAEGWAFVRVVDSGVGIAQEMLGRIFELFTQVDRSLDNAQGGLGIGLNLAQRLALLHGGRIEAQSEGLGCGSTFTLVLPLAAGAEMPARPRKKVVTQLAGVRRVLIADDNVDAAMSLSALLQAVGHDVCTAHDGLEALDLAARFEPDVAILDIGMPRLNGYEVAVRMRADGNCRKTMLIALTGWSQDEDRRRASEVGFDDHLVKPVDPKVLLSVIGDGRAA